MFCCGLGSSLGIFFATSASEDSASTSSALLASTSPSSTSSSTSLSKWKRDGELGAIPVLVLCFKTRFGEAFCVLPTRCHSLSFVSFSVTFVM
ncbi:hypothetical protein F2Q70_00017107 [Brassica cretica]|uniref:Uncharacterized protein n=1 Tax=Brassica cretica TaxID=69181 RepID=A0A8S9HVA2_BRACR|nr:hypothetical protein F2Q70_00017107 [Brassica cretica]